MVRFSIIVPVYNTESTIKICVESVLNQSVQDYQLILVDDGSKDQSGSICDDYASKDSRIKTIHQKNSGVSAARNAGIKAAEGEYILFLDSDDFLEQNALREFSAADADIIIGGVNVFDGNVKIDTYCSRSERYRISSETNIAQFYNEWYSGWVWNKCFKRGLIEVHNLRFDSELNFGEDTLFCMEYAKLAASVQVIGEITYNWCKTPVSFLRNPGDNYINKFNLLNEKLLLTFADMPVVQESILKKYYWAIEVHIKSVCSSNESFFKKVSTVRKIIKSPIIKNAENKILERKGILALAIDNGWAILICLIYAINRE